MFHENQWGSRSLVIVKVAEDEGVITREQATVLTGSPFSPAKLAELEGKVSVIMARDVRCDNEASFIGELAARIDKALDFGIIAGLEAESLRVTLAAGGSQKVLRELDWREAEFDHHTIEPEGIDD